MARADFQQSFQSLDAASNSHRGNNNDVWGRGESKGEDLTGSGHNASEGNTHHLNDGSGASFLCDVPAAAVVAALAREAQDEQWWGGAASVTAAVLNAHTVQDTASTTDSATLPAEGNTVRQYRHRESL